MPWRRGCWNTEPGRERLGFDLRGGFSIQVGGRERKRGVEPWAGSWRVGQGPDEQ